MATLLLWADAAVKLLVSAVLLVRAERMRRRHSRTCYPPL